MHDIVFHRFQGDDSFKSIRQRIRLFDVPVVLRHNQGLSIILLGEILGLNGNGRLLFEHCLISHIFCNILRHKGVLSAQDILRVLFTPANKIPTRICLGCGALGSSIDLDLLRSTGNRAAFGGFIVYRKLCAFPVGNKDQIALRALFNSYALIGSCNLRASTLASSPSKERIPCTGRIVQREGLSLNGIFIGVLRHGHSRTFRSIGQITDGEPCGLHLEHNNVFFRCAQGYTLCFLIVQGIAIPQLLIEHVGIGTHCNGLCFRHDRFCGMQYLVAILILNGIAKARGRVIVENNLVYCAALQHNRFRSFIDPVCSVVARSWFCLGGIAYINNTSVGLCRGNISKLAITKIGQELHCVFCRGLFAHMGIDDSISRDWLVEVKQLRTFLCRHKPTIEGIPFCLRYIGLHLAVIGNRFRLISFTVDHKSHGQFRHIPIRIQNQAHGHFIVARIEFCMSGVGIPTFEGGTGNRRCRLSQVGTDIRTDFYLIAANLFTRKAIQVQRVLVGRIVEIEVCIVILQTIITWIAIIPPRNRRVIPLITSDGEVFLVIGQTAVEVKAGRCIFAERPSLILRIVYVAVLILDIIMQIPCSAAGFLKLAVHVLTRHIVLVNSLCSARPTPLVFCIARVSANVGNPPIANICVILSRQTRNFGVTTAIQESQGIGIARIVSIDGGRTVSSHSGTGTTAKSKMRNVKALRLGRISVGLSSSIHQCRCGCTAHIGVSIIIRIFREIRNGIVHNPWDPLGIKGNVVGQGDGGRRRCCARRIRVPAFQGIAGPSGFGLCRNGLRVAIFCMGMFLLPAHNFIMSLEETIPDPFIARAAMCMRLLTTDKIAARLSRGANILQGFLIHSGTGRYIAAALGIIGQRVGIAGVLNLNRNTLGSQRLLGDFTGREARLFLGNGLGHIAVPATQRIFLRFIGRSIHAGEFMHHGIIDHFGGINNRHFIGAIRLTGQVCRQRISIQMEKPVRIVAQRHSIPFFGGYSSGIGVLTGLQFFRRNLRRKNHAIIGDKVDLDNAGADGDQFHIVKRTDKDREQGNARSILTHSLVAVRHFIGQVNVGCAIRKGIQGNLISLNEFEAFALVCQYGCIVHSVHEIVRRQSIFDVFIHKCTNIRFQNMVHIQLVALFLRSRGGRRSRRLSRGRSCRRGRGRSRGCRRHRRSRSLGCSRGRSRRSRGRRSFRRGRGCRSRGCRSFRRGRGCRSRSRRSLRRSRSRRSLRRGRGCRGLRRSYRGFRRSRSCRLSAFFRQKRNLVVSFRRRLFFPGRFVGLDRRCCIAVFCEDLDRRQGSQHREDQQNADHAACFEP